MGSLTTFGRNFFINHTFNASQTNAATVYLVLCTSDPTIAATGASCGEVANANNYARTAISFGSSAARRITQNAQVEFPTASGSWSTVTHWCLATSETYGSGNILAFGGFSSSFAPVAGNTPRVASGQVYIEISASAGAGFTTAHVNSMLGYMFGNVAYASKAGSTYIALLGGNSSDTATTMAGQTEITGTAYARRQINVFGGASPAWTNSTTGSISNGAAAAYSTVGSGGWSQIVACAIVDASSGTSANVIAYDNSNIVDQTPSAGDTVQFPLGSFTVSMT